MSVRTVKIYVEWEVGLHLARGPDMCGQDSEEVLNIQPDRQGGPVELHPLQLRYNLPKLNHHGQKK